jgi:hypothetical protein
MNPESKRKYPRVSGLVLTSCLLACAVRGNTWAQASGGATSMLKLYVDPATKIVYTEPGKGRRLLTEVPATTFDVDRLQRQQEQTEARLSQTQQELSDLAQKNKALADNNFQLSQQVAEITRRGVTTSRTFKTSFGSARWCTRITACTRIRGFSRRS